MTAGGIDGTPRHVLIFTHAGSVPGVFRFPDSPALRDLAWRVFVDTSRAPPDDIVAGGDGPEIDVSQPLELAERSLVCLVADAGPPPPRRRIGLSRP